MPNINNAIYTKIFTGAYAPEVEKFCNKWMEGNKELITDVEVQFFVTQTPITKSAGEFLTEIKYTITVKCRLTQLGLTLGADKVFGFEG